MLSHFHISSFRGISERQIGLTRRTAIIGVNGSGKTHILEGVHLVSGGILHYFHAPKDDSYSLSLVVEDGIGPKVYALQRSLGSDRYMIQSSKVSGVKYRDELPYRTVFLSPFDMNLLYFAPSHRRDYMDSILMRSYAQFPKLKREYEAVMRQRNALLKKIRDGEARSGDLDFWDKCFAEKALLYTTYREQWVDFMHAQIRSIHDFLPKYEIKFTTESKLIGATEPDVLIRDYLRDNRERDILTGHTHIGPHLDDFGFSVVDRGSKIETRNAYPATIHDLGFTTIDATMMLSRGEMKMLLLALKQIEILFLRKIMSLPIVLLFDDLFAELDQDHAARVIDIFDADQVIVTTQRSLPSGEKWDDFSCIMLEIS